MILQKINKPGANSLLLNKEKSAFLFKYLLDNENLLKGGNENNGYC